MSKTEKLQTALGVSFLVGIVAVSLWSFIELNLECDQKACPNNGHPHLAARVGFHIGYECVCEAR